MKLVNLFGGPGSGKSTAAATLFSILKTENHTVELVGEFAKELIYLGNEIQLVNQVYVMGSQYRKQKDLQRYGIELGICDSPLQLQLTYCKKCPYYQEIKALIEKLTAEFDNCNVFIERAAPYQLYGRVQSQVEADILSQEIWESMNGNFDLVVKGNKAGLTELTDFVKAKLKK